MSTLDVNKSYSDLSGTVARLKAAGMSDEEIAHLDPTSWEFQEGQKQAMLNARVTVEEPVNVSEQEVSRWYKGARSAIQSGSRVLIMSLIELVRGLFPFVVMITLILADGVRLFHSINLLVADNGISTLLAIVGILAYLLIVYTKSEATYNYIDSNEVYEKWSIGIWLSDIRYKFFSLGGSKFQSRKMSKAEWEYRKSISSVFAFKLLMFSLIVFSPLLDYNVIKALFGTGSAQANFFTGQIDGQAVATGLQAPVQIVLATLLNAFLTIQFLSMLDSNIAKAYALYADRDGDHAKGAGYFLEQQRQYRVRIEEVEQIAQAAFLKGRQQQAKLMLAQISQNQISANSKTSLITTEEDPNIIQSLPSAVPPQPTIAPVLRDLGQNPSSSQAPNQILNQPYPVSIPMKQNNQRMSPNSQTNSQNN